MASEAQLVPADSAHAEALARAMRAEDAAECRAGGLEPLEAVLTSLEGSDIALAAIVDGEVGAMFGVGPLAGVSDRVGHVWFLTAEPFAKNPRPYMRVARKAISVMLDLYPILFNIIDARYDAAVRWAKWLKFDVSKTTHPFGPDGLPFIAARLTREAWVG